MRIIIDLENKHETLEEIYISTWPEWLHADTHKIRKAMFGVIQAEDMGWKKLQELTLEEVEEIKSLAIEPDKGYHIPTQEENDEAWLGDPE